MLATTADPAVEQHERFSWSIEPSLLHQTLRLLNEFLYIVICNLLYLTANSEPVYAWNSIYNALYQLTQPHTPPLCRSRQPNTLRPLRSPPHPNQPTSQKTPRGYQQTTPCPQLRIKPPTPPHPNQRPTNRRPRQRRQPNRTKHDARPNSQAPVVPRAERVHGRRVQRLDAGGREAVEASEDVQGGEGGRADPEEEQHGGEQGGRDERVQRADTAVGEQGGDEAAGEVGGEHGEEEVG